MTLPKPWLWMLQRMETEKMKQAPAATSQGPFHILLIDQLPESVLHASPQSLTPPFLVRLVMTSNLTDCFDVNTPSIFLIVAARSERLDFFILSELPCSATLAAVIISGDTLVKKGASSLITSAVYNGASGLNYNWQDSTAAHGWQSIGIASSSSINYVPLSTGDMLRCIVANNVLCPYVSNTKTFIVGSVTDTKHADTTSRPNTTSPTSTIRQYPNPVVSTLYIDKSQNLHIKCLARLFTTTGKDLFDHICYVGIKTKLPKQKVSGAATTLKTGETEKPYE
jgi:hypothetical protein